MGTITTADGTKIFYKDWGSGRPVVFSHGWPLNADAWDEVLMFTAAHGYRAIAHDRRGHGRSDQPWTGNDMDTYADDLATLLDTLDLRDAVLVGHSTGGGEVTRYLGRHGTGRVAKLVLRGAVPPLMLRTPANPDGLPMFAFDKLRDGVRTDRSQFYRELSAPFFGANRPGAQVSQGVRDAFWLMSMQVGAKAAVDCVEAFSETDFTEDLERIDVPTLVAHGDDDQIVPFQASAARSAALLKNANPQGVLRRAARSLRSVPGRVQRRSARLHPSLTPIPIGPWLEPPYVVPGPVRRPVHRGRLRRVAHARGA